ncbi:MAG TPA: hypothetical protein VGE55_04475 [Limnobacter sp.]|uniref:hypothetical protein n=1 Tax=Limnobacter sp. TaxID=2003368 RepID=UPI002ED7BF28
MNNQFPAGLFGFNLPLLNVQPQQAVAPAAHAAAPGQHSPATPPEPQAPMAAVAAQMAHGLNPLAPAVPQWPAPAGSPHTPPDQIMPAFVPPAPGFLQAALQAHVMGALPVLPHSPVVPLHLNIGGHVGAGRNLLAAFNAPSPESAASDQTRVQASPPSVCKPGAPARRRDDGFDDGSPNPRPRQQLRA